MKSGEAALLRSLEMMPSSTVLFVIPIVCNEDLATSKPYVELVGPWNCGSTRWDCLFGETSGGRVRDAESDRP